MLLLLLQLLHAHLSGTTSTGWNTRKNSNWKELVLYVLYMLYVLYVAAYRMILPSKFI